MRQIALQRRPAMLPARLVALLVLALGLGAISISKLRAATGAAAIRQLDWVQKQLPAAGGHEAPGGEAQVRSD